MIVADLTIWSAALRGHNRGLDSLFNALMQRGELTAPTLVFVRLLAETDEPNDATRLRQWGLAVPEYEETRAAALAGGDLAAHLAAQGFAVDVADAVTLALCLREDWPLWSQNPRLVSLGALLPTLRRYQPAGV